MFKLTRILVVLFVSIGVSLAGQIAAAQQNKKKQNNAAVDEANKKDKDAKDADAKADTSKKAIAEANDAIHAAQKDVDEANKTLKKVEDDTIEAQSADSEVGKARDSYRAADKKYQEARKSVLEDPSFVQRKEEAKDADDGGESLRALQKEFAEMPVIAESRTAMQSARESYEPLKTKLLQGTQDWVTANEDLQAKKKALDEARHKYAEAVAAAKKAKADAQKAAAEARLAEHQAAASQQQPNQPPRRRPRY